MKIDGIETVESDAEVRVSALLRWEDSERPDQTLYFASPRIRASEHRTQRISSTRKAGPDQYDAAEQYNCTTSVRRDSVPRKHRLTGNY